MSVSLSYPETKRASNLNLSFVYRTSSECVVCGTPFQKPNFVRDGTGTSARGVEKFSKFLPMDHDRCRKLALHCHQCTY